MPPKRASKRLLEKKNKNSDVDTENTAKRQSTGNVSSSQSSSSGSTRVEFKGPMTLERARKIAVGNLELFSTNDTLDSMVERVMAMYGSPITPSSNSPDRLSTSNTPSSIGTDTPSSASMSPLSAGSNSLSYQRKPLSNIKTNKADDNKDDEKRSQYDKEKEDSEVLAESLNELKRALKKQADQKERSHRKLMTKKEKEQEQKLKEEHEEEASVIRRDKQAKLAKQRRENEKDNAQKKFNAKHERLSKKRLSEIGKKCAGRQITVLSNPLDSVFFKKINKAKSTMFTKLPIVKEFLANLSKKQVEHPDDYFISAQDPFFRAMRMKTRFDNRSNSGPHVDADRNLELSKEDPIQAVLEFWTEKKQYVLPHRFTTFLSQKSGIRKLAEALKLPIIENPDLSLALELQDPYQRFEDLQYLGAKFMLALKQWKTKNNCYPRVAHYFFYVAQDLLEFCHPDSDDMDSPDSIRGQVRFLRDLLMWLPIHLGDLRTENHAPRECLADLARQLFAYILNEFQTVCHEITSEDVYTLQRVQLAFYRLEMSAPDATPLHDWFAGDSQNEIKRKLGNTLREEKRIRKQEERRAREQERLERAARLKMLYR